QEGERLFDDAGEPTEFMKGVQSYLEQLDAELQRTRAFCQRLVELGLLQDMRFDAQMEDGQTLVVDGFLAVNEQKLAELPDATVVELHRAGILALLYAHIGSMAVMRRLVERRVALKLPV
ncbi:MAG: SapC family protein, partial [Betaproteobacteria bacterium]